MAFRRPPRCSLAVRRYTVSARKRLSLEQAAALAHHGNPFPDLAEHDPLLDVADTSTFPRPHGPPNRLVARNDPSIFEWARMTEALDAYRTHGDPAFADPECDPHEDVLHDDGDDDAPRRTTLPAVPHSRGGLHVYPLIVRRVTQQTGKGKIPSMYALVVVGNGAGLVGCGEAKDAEAAVARDRAYARALRSIDHVDRFEDRTFWSPVDTKFGATRLLLRPRPVGFGLRCGPVVHQVLKAAGIKDASAKVWGSRNPLTVVKSLFRVLHAGHAPLAMGNGVGGGAPRLDKGSGLRGLDALQRDRGRRLVDLRTF